MSKQEPGVEEIAELCAPHHLFHMGSAATAEARRKLIQNIEAALRARDERAANICEQGAMLASPEGVIPAGDPEHEHLQRVSDVLNSAARAIREGKE